MPQVSVIYFNVAAVVIMMVTFASLILRGMTRGATNRVYLTSMALVTITALTCLVGQLCDVFRAVSSAQADLAGLGSPSPERDAVELVYYALRTLTAPMYLLLIATVSDTTHKLDDSNRTRILLWTPMMAVLVLVLSNPAHHLVFHYDAGVPRQGPLAPIVYLGAAYYSVIGIGWLVHWRKLLTKIEFTTFMAIYPLVLLSVVVQYCLPDLQIEMFVTSIAMLIVSAFVIRPEKRIDSLVNAASLNAYHELCRRAFISGKPLCLIYLEIVNLERIRELIGKDEAHGVVQAMSANLSKRLERDDVLYYLRDGIFCISSRNTDVDHALAIAQEAHEEGRRKSIERNERMPRNKMRTCIVRVPEDVNDNETLKAFIRRFEHLVPHSTVTTYAELSQQEGFAVEMGLSGIVAKAIQERSFTVSYQPIWNLKHKRFHSAEALVRLEDPTHGQIPPSLFIPEAEQNGSIVDIGSILLEKICIFLGHVDFEATGLEYLEVNLSVDQCIHPALAPELIGLIHAYRVDPKRINLEITETSSSYSRIAIEENVRALEQEGVSFSLDDYGTGYSNITRALALPFSLVKLDKSFVDGIEETSTQSVLRDTVAMMKKIGKDVLVEGVETEHQSAILEDMGVDYIQGYHYAKPMPEEEFVAFLVSQKQQCEPHECGAEAAPTA